MAHYLIVAFLAGAALLLTVGHAAAAKIDPRRRSRR